MKKVLGLLILFVVVFFSYLIYYGLFDKVNIVEKKAGPFILVYEKHTGPYSETGEIQNKIYEKLLNLGVKTTRGFGIYFDDPKKVDEKKLRSVAGCVLNREDNGKIPEIKKTMKVMKMPESDSIYAEFSYKGMMSVILGINKVYPEINRYKKEKKYDASPSMELFDVPAEKIIYIVPLNMDKAFFEKLIAD